MPAAKQKNELTQLINADFNSPQNLAFQKRVFTTYHAPAKPIVFLPCAAGKKRQKGLGYSQCMTHQVMSIITKNPAIEKIVLSEPLVAVPYKFEREIPLYNYPPKLLTPNDETIFVNRTAQFLTQLKQQEQSRTIIYYVGGKHHADILEKANKKANSPFNIKAYVASRMGYGRESKRLIQDMVCKTKPSNHYDCIEGL